MTITETIHRESRGPRKSFATLMTIGLFLYVSACSSPIKPAPSALLRTDSAAVGVGLSGGFTYHAKIGFEYVNTTPNPVSRRGCGGPGAPDLEKKVNGEWVVAYYPIYALCLTLPDFKLESGATYHGVLDFLAFQPGRNSEPTLRVDSIDGVYRLRWDFVKGTDAGAKGARKVEAVSNEFRMTLGAP